MSNAPRAVIEAASASDAAEAVLTAEVLELVADVVREFRPRVAERLAARVERQRRFDDGERPRFLESTRAVREGDWRVAPAPPELRDRRVEITGPTDRKMMINALNSGAKVFMADLEDSTTPTWDNLLQGQVNLLDAARRTLAWDAPDGRRYELRDPLAVLFVRPRGWHLVERNVAVEGEPIPGALLDATVFLARCARPLLDRASGPYLYLPKLESHLEARLWNDVLGYLERRLGLDYGTVRVTVLIETLPAAFEMDEILYELRDRITGLNCGRWDYIFSFVKCRRADPTAILPDRDQVTMTQPFLRAYARLCVETCHRRGAHAMGGMAAQIPIKNDPRANDLALAAVRADKEREVADGHDGTWVAHPGLVPVATEVFDRVMPGPNQLDRRWPELEVGADDLLAVPTGTRTLRGLRTNLRVAAEYLSAWLAGTGCVPIDHRMEDAATAEISRVQVWQWLHHGVTLDDPPGMRVTPELVREVLDQECTRLDGARLAEARDLVRSLVLAPTLEPFLTVPAYARLR
jgi:malate synthase